MTDQVWLVWKKPILSKMNLTAFAKLSLKQRTTDLEQRPLDRRDQVEILQAWQWRGDEWVCFAATGPGLVAVTV